jgi:RecA-family ATPase
MDILNFEQPSFPTEETHPSEFLWNIVDLAAALQAPRKPTDFVIPGLKAGTLGALVATSGTGKSYLALEIAMAVASPLADITGFCPQLAGKVLYINGEDPEDELITRISWISERVPPEAYSQLKDNLKIISAMGSLLDFGWRPQMKSRKINQDLENFIEIAAGCRLIIIDTLTRFHTLNENDNGQMSQLLGNFEHVITRTGAALLFIHHTNKSSTKDKDTDNQTAARGADALIAHSRFATYLVKMTENEANRYDVDPEKRGMYLRFGVSKQNYGLPQKERWFERKEGGVLIPINLIPKPKRSNRNEA